MILAHLRRFALLSWLLTIAMMSLLLPEMAWIDAYNSVFTVLAYASYAAFYLLPFMTLAWLLARYAKLNKSAATVAVVSSALILIFLYADARILSMYGFHINGFVINLLLTPGGIDSLGGDAATQIGFALIIAIVLAGQWLLWRLCQRDAVIRFMPLKRFSLVIGLLVVATIAERLMFGFADLRARGQTLSVAQTIPLYQATRLRTVGKKWGLLVPQQRQLSVKQEGQLQYPLKPLEIHTPAQPYNIIWLVSESLRADMLNEKIMPTTWEFAKKGQRFTHHFSGGNGTRFGMFSLFTGLPGSYWFSFLDDERGAAVMDVVLAQNYQLHLSTAQSFTYPEFERTLFVRVPRENMHVDDQGDGHERDRRNIKRLIDALDARDPSKPIFAFNFFESPHARYYFDEQTAIEKDYLADFNYARADVDSLRRDIVGIKNRYINAVHALDETLTPLWHYLERQQMLDNTIVIFTGDHGEEFMEQGRWGHNSEFVNEQIHVPLVMWLPGQAATVDDRFSAHMDVTATIMPRLGVRNPTSDYALGFDLTQPPQRHYTLLADWERVAYFDRDVKIAIPMTAKGFAQQTVSTANDAPVTDEASVMQQKQSALLQAMRDVSAFKKLGKRE